MSLFPGSYSPKNHTVVVIGLGYVGLPLALAFGRKGRTIGFDISESKIAAYRQQVDPTKELTAGEFQSATHMEYTTDPALIRQGDFVIVAVPTPIDAAKQPDLTPVHSASVLVGKNLKPGATIVYESTVYPGLTEEYCGPIIEAESGLKRGVDFKLGYSPERINPGDKEHSFEKIIKVVSGEDAASLEAVSSLYSAVVDAGVFKAASIKVAEAAKVIENTQRDLNIALMNELSLIFGKMGIDTLEVLQAAGTKWNFLPFRPGLVGGHCIGVDPYYLTYKANLLGYHPEVILAGRRINDQMGKHIAEQTIKHLIEADRPVKGAKVLVMGLTFKENVSDLRNSRVIDIIQELNQYGVHTLVWDPVAIPHEALEEYGVELVDFDRIDKVDALVAAVSHRAILQKPLKDFVAKSHKGAPFIDVKGAFDRSALKENGFRTWRL